MPHVDLPRNRRQRGDKATKIQVVPSHPLLRYQANEDDHIDEPHRSCNLDDDDENWPFSKKLRNVHMSSHYLMPNILKYDERGDPAKQLYSYKTHTNLRGTIFAMKYKAFHLTLSGITKIWYNRLPQKVLKPDSSLKPRSSKDFP